MDGENNNASADHQQQQQPIDGQPDQEVMGNNLNNTEAQLAQEEAFLEAQAQSLAEVKRRRKE